MGKPKPYCATTEQVWALYDAMPDDLRPAILLGAFAGLRRSECAALKVTDVDWLRATITPARQWPDRPLKTVGSAASVPVPRELIEMLSDSMRKYGVRCPAVFQP
jgi:integrase